MAYKEITSAINEPPVSLPAQGRPNTLYANEFGGDIHFDPQGNGSWVKLGQDVQNVRAHGAKGDDSTDDTQAFQDALDAIPANGGTIYVPTGIYILDGWTLNRSDIVMRGEGAASTLKLKAGSHNSTGALSVEGSNGSPLTNVAVCNLKFDGNRANVSGLDVEALNVAWLKECTISNCWAIEGLGEGIDIDESIRLVIDNCHTKDCNGYGIHISVNSEEVCVSNSTAENCGFVNNRGGMDMWGNTQNCQYVNCITTDCRVGFSIRGDSQNVSNCHSIRPQLTAFDMTHTGSRWISLNNCIADTAGGFGYEIDADRNVTISNSKAINCSNQANGDADIIIQSSYNTITNFVSYNNQEADGIRIGANHNNVDNVMINNPVRDAINLRGSNCRVSNVNAVGGSNRAHFHMAVCNGSSFTNCYSLQAGDRAYWIRDAPRFQIRGCEAESPVTRSIRVEGTSDGIISHCWIDNVSDTEPALSIDANPNCMISFNRVFGSGTSDDLLLNNNDHTIIGNQLLGSGTSTLNGTGNITVGNNPTL